MVTRTSFLVSSIAVGLAVAGCDMVGPPALNQSRPDYNNVIQYTSKQQTFMNVIRSYNYDTPLFMDVTEVDLGLQFQGSLNGSYMFPDVLTYTAAGAHTGSQTLPRRTGHDYTVGGALQYQETPTIRYQPLSGQALIAQILTPINVDSLAALFDSDWPLSSVLSMALDRLTRVDADYYCALDALIKLDEYNALIISPTKSDAGVSGVPSPLGSQTGNDTLVIYCAFDRIMDPMHNPSAARRDHAKILWHRLWRIFGDSQPSEIREGDNRIELRTVPRAFPTYQDSVQRKTFQQLPSKSPIADSDLQVTTQRPPIRIVTPLEKPSGPPLQRKYQYMPVLKTHSAIGILKDVTREGYDLAVFVSPATFERSVRPMVRRANKAIDDGSRRNFYVFHAKALSGEIEQIAVTRPTTQDTSDDCNKSDASFGVPPTLDDLHPVMHYSKGSAKGELWGVQEYEDDGDFEDRSDRDRHFMIIIHGTQPPPQNAYVFGKYGQEIYWIDAEDRVSQLNFTLIQHFMTIQAIPGQSQSLTPTIGVGGGSGGASH